MGSRRAARFLSASTFNRSSAAASSLIYVIHGGIDPYVAGPTAIGVFLGASAGAGERPSGRAVDAAARDVIDAAGHGEHFGHGTGHGIGLATHEAPSLSRRAAEEPLPSPTVFSVEPGVYLDGLAGVRIEDLVLFDADGRRLELLTSFPREVTVVG